MEWVLGIITDPLISQVSSPVRDDAKTNRIVLVERPLDLYLITNLISVQSSSHFFFASFFFVEACGIVDRLNCKLLEQQGRINRGPGKTYASI